MSRRLATAAALFLGALVMSAHADTVIAPPVSVVPPSFFGMHMHRAASRTPWPTVPFATWRLWDAYTAWPNLEPKKGEWHFEVLDKTVALAEKNHVEVLLPLGLSPAWASARPTEKSTYAPGNAAEPANIEDWRSYVRTVARRYKGRVRYYEIWNEPNLKEFFSGSVSQMLELAREAHAILKSVDPAIVVVSPSAVGGSSGVQWLDEYLAKGGGQFCDVIGYHFYVTPQPPEAMLPLIAKVRGAMSRHGVAKPLWNTEAGWDMKKQFETEEAASAYVARSYILNWAAGVERFYWYAWDNAGWVSLRMTKEDLTPTASAKAYAEVQKWLVGARMTSCTADRSGLWTCRLTRDGGYQATVVWHPEGPANLRLEKGWGVRAIRGVDGKPVAVAEIVRVSPSPIILENRQR